MQSMAEREAEREAGAGGAELQVAEWEASAGPLAMRARVQATPAGLLAVGVLVSGILLSTSVLVWSATNVARRHPVLRRLGR